MAAERFETVGVGETPEGAFAAGQASGGPLASKEGISVLRPHHQFRTSAEGLLRALDALDRGEDAAARGEFPSATEWSAFLAAYELADSPWGPAACVRLPEGDPRAVRALLDAPLGTHAYLFRGWVRD